MTFEPPGGILSLSQASFRSEGALIKFGGVILAEIDDVSFLLSPTKPLSVFG